MLANVAGTLAALRRRGRRQAAGRRGLRACVRAESGEGLTQVPDPSQSRPPMSDPTKRPRGGRYFIYRPPRTVAEVPSTPGSAPLATPSPCPAVQLSAALFPSPRIVRDEFQLARDEVPSSYRCRGHRRGGARHGGVRWILRGRRHGTAVLRGARHASGFLTRTRGLREGVPHVARTTYAVVC